MFLSVTMASTAPSSYLTVKPRHDKLKSLVELISPTRYPPPPVTRPTRKALLAIFHLFSVAETRPDLEAQLSNYLWSVQPWDSAILQQLERPVDSALRSFTRELKMPKPPLNDTFAKNPGRHGKVQKLISLVSRASPARRTITPAVRDRLLWLYHLFVSETLVDIETHICTYLSAVLPWHTGWLRDLEPQIDAILAAFD